MRGKVFRFRFKQLLNKSCIIYYTAKTISPEITWGALRAVEIDPSWRNIAQVWNARGGRAEQEQNLHKYINRYIIIYFINV